MAPKKLSKAQLEAAAEAEAQREKAEKKAKQASFVATLTSKIKYGTATSEDVEMLAAYKNCSRFDLEKEKIMNTWFKNGKSSKGWSTYTTDRSQATVTDHPSKKRGYGTMCPWVCCLFLGGSPKSQTTSCI